MRLSHLSTQVYDVIVQTFLEYFLSAGCVPESCDCDEDQGRVLFLQFQSTGRRRISESGRQSGEEKSKDK